LLSQAPALTSLRLQDKLDPYSRLAHVAACSKLRNLYVLDPRLYGIAWPVFFAHAHIQQLHSLKLDLFFAQGTTNAVGPTQQDYVIAFANMRRLHTLHLARCDGVDLMLPALVHAPWMDQLRAVGESIDTSDTQTAPSGLVLVALLLAVPRLRCVLNFCHVNGPAKDYSALRQRVQARFNSDAIFSTDQFAIR